MSSVSCDAKAPATVIHGSHLCDLRITPRNPANPRQCLLSGVFEKSTSYCYMPPMGGRTMPQRGLVAPGPRGAFAPRPLRGGSPRCLSMQKGGRVRWVTRRLSTCRRRAFLGSGAYSGLWAGVGLSTALSVGEGFPPFVSSAAKQACCYFDLAFSLPSCPSLRVRGSLRSPEGSRLRDTEASEASLTCS